MKITTRKIFIGTELHTCKNCGHSFKGKVCNICGEKVFDNRQLSAGHFFHEVIDFFYHWESKVLKTIKLNFLKPGFVTKENLRGIRVPYARPAQLYLVVAFAFYLIVGRIGVTDYIPASDDHHYYSLSVHKLFKWAAPLDNFVEKGIDTMWVKKGVEIQQQTDEDLHRYNVYNNAFIWRGRGNTDSIILPLNKIPIVSFRQMTEIREHAFQSHVATYGKTFIFILLPFFAGIFFLIFYKHIKYYGAALILATHFMVYNLCFYSLAAVVNIAPRNIAKGLTNWMMKPFEFVFYNAYTTPFSEFVFGGSFEFFHLLFWMPWLYIAFKRLFGTLWWKNLLASYFCSRIFFYLLFGVLKKALIAFTIWSIHV